MFQVLPLKPLPKTKLFTNSSLIFLDIDGVLNSEQTIDWKQNSLNIDPNAVGLLNKIISATNAKIVISSYWRNKKTIIELKKLLKNNGFTGEIVGVTPSYQVQGRNLPRGVQIDLYLKESRIKNYIILDDSEGMLMNQQKRFIKTDQKNGLTVENVNRAINLLRNKKA